MPRLVDREAERGSEGVGMTVSLGRLKVLCCQSSLER